MHKSAIFLFLFSSLVQGASFFATKEIQSQSPQAFALQKDAADFIQTLEARTREEKELLVETIRKDKILMDAISDWNRLSIDEQIPYLRKVFSLECQALKITPPDLVIQPGIIKGAAFFEFDPEKPGVGKVILNPEALAKEENKYISLALLIHETRHSAQFQLAFASGIKFRDPLAIGYKAAFIIQKKLQGKLGFCDFLTLLNEYEAFQFGNYVLGKLTDFKLDMIDMGTFASQYDSRGELKIDLPKLANEVGYEKLLEKFNELEKVQKELLGGK